MKLFIIFVSLFYAFSAGSDSDSWQQFKQEYSKTYKNLKDEHFRFDIFKSNLRLIEEHNLKYQNGEESYYMSVNKFADLTDEEFDKFYLNSNLEATKGHDAVGTFELDPNLNAIIPKSFDWRDKGAVLSIKNQLDCGSCWAFSALASLEGQNAIKHNITIDLSAQELLDCSGPNGNNGCFGGWMNYAFNYIKENGIASEKNYSYTATYFHHCDQLNITRAPVTISGYKDIPANNEAALTEAIATVGPIAVAINATLIRNYGGGIFDNADCSDKVSHGVVAVGYGSEGDHDYYIIKNSWGPKWGDHGYIKMARNKANQCCIACYASYPLII